MVCPRCQGLLFTDEDRHGQFLNCPTCGWQRDTQFASNPKYKGPARPGANYAPKGPEEDRVTHDHGAPTARDSP